MQFAADRIGRKYYDYVTDYRVLVEGQLRVAEEFGFDHVGCISDPTREAADCGAAIIFHEDSPPDIDESNALLADKSRLAKLKMPDPLGGGRMHDRVKAAALFKEKAGKDKIIEGWIEGPCAEGADLRGINTIMTDFFEDAGFVKELFEFATELGLKFAKAQIEAGVDLMGIGDAAASLVGPKIYEEFVWPYEKRLVDGIHKMGAAVRLHICGDTRKILEGMGRLGAEMIDLDYPSPDMRLPEKKWGQSRSSAAISIRFRCCVMRRLRKFTRRLRFVIKKRAKIYSRGRLRSYPRYAYRKSSRADGLRDFTLNQLTQLN